MRFLTRLRFLTKMFTLLVMSSPAFALSLGDVHVKSEFGQALEAEIDIPSYTPQELEGLVVKLADKTVFDESKVELNSNLRDLRFEVRPGKNGKAPVVHVSSKSGIQELAFHFFVEANWTGGRLVRGYDVLLMPAQESDQSVSGTVTTISPMQQVTVNSVKVANNPQNSSAVPMVAVASKVETKVNTQSKLSYGPVKRGEIVGFIARRMVPSRDFTLQQVMAAIYKQNPHAFAESNINQLLPGVSLKLASEDSIAETAHMDAVNLIAKQERAWSQGPRANLTSNTDVATSLFKIEGASDVAMEQSAPGNSDTLAFDEESAIKPEELELMRQELNDSLATATALKKENEDLRARIELLEELVAERMTLVVPEAPIANPEPVALNEKTSIIGKSSTETTRDDLLSFGNDEFSFSNLENIDYSESFGAILVLLGVLIMGLLYSTQRRREIRTDRLVNQNSGGFMDVFKRRFPTKVDPVTARL
ncbi:MAG: hypothetical protein OEZ43_12980 [Gammaproteobacteria bacterium]|nr:hypothetical protein [Gammaproteobacteria bacterium]